MQQLAVIYGGITPEHEVSIITAVQLMENVDQEKYQLVPIYIDKSGGWWTGKQLLDIDYYRTQDLQQPTGLQPYSISPVKNDNQLDVAILCFHGGYGESGNIQGLLELANIPYQGPEILGANAAYDKILSRQIFTAENIGQTEHTWFTDQEWKKDRKQVLAEIEKLGLPVFIKPSRSGSSIGIQRVTQQKNLVAAIEQVLKFDYRVLVEAEIQDCIEVNVSVLGGDSVQASIPEQPIKGGEFLSFSDKYEKGGGKKQGMAGASRRIPAPISSKMTTKLQNLAKRIFHIFDCTGVVRIDFFVNPSSEEIYVTEVNTIPGSMSYYLWAASDVSYPELIERLIKIAKKRQAKKQNLVQSFHSNILNKDL